MRYCNMTSQQDLDHAAYHEARQSLIDAVYGQMLREGLSDLAVILLDPAEPAARSFAESTCMSELLASRIALSRLIGRRLSATWVLPRAEAVTELSRAFPRIADAIADPPDNGCYWVVVMAAGLVSASMVTTVPETGG
jgi:hypothetical protein